MNARRLLSVLATIAVAGASVAQAAPQAVPEGPIAGAANHAIEVDLTPETGTLAGADVIDVDAASVSIPNAPFRFLLHRGLAIESMSLDGKPLRWDENGDWNPKHFWAKPDYARLDAYAHLREIEVHAPDRWTSPARIEVRYQGVIADSLHPPEEDYGRSFETTTGLIEGRGAYLDGATGWMPTVPGDFFTFTLTARVPKDWDVVSQGDIVHREDGTSARTVKLVSREPMDGVYLVAGPWQRFEARHGSTDVLVYLYTDEPELRERYVAATGRYLDRFEREIGPYPYSKFALVENFWETGYGMPSFTLLGSTVLRLPFIVNTSYGHEILHCWWGNGVFVDTDRGNWCEGLTSYLADHAFKEDESAQAAVAYRRDQLTGYLNFVRSSRDIPLRAFRERHSGATQAIGYGKSLFVFHMLRRQLGDDAFFGALRAFYAANRFRAASWEDLFASFEEAGHVDLDRFFDQWIMRTGAPSLRLVGPVATARGDGFDVEGTLVETDPVYVLDVPVEVTLEDGTRTAFRVQAEALETPFKLHVAGRPARVAVDPAFEVFRRLDRAEIPPVLDQTLGADSTIIVVTRHATPELGAAYEALAVSFARERGVRVVHDGELDLARADRAAIWLFGSTSFDDAWKAAEPAGPVPGANGAVQQSWIGTKRHPGNAELSWSRLELGDAASAAAIGRKIPHYGKYSYLLFDGTTNAGKGVWELAQSPLVQTLASRTP